jgi:hypothetical protein
MFKSETQTEQAREITRVIRRLADIVPVAVCSGNHDNVGRLVSHDRASVYEWFLDLGEHRNIIRGEVLVPGQLLGAPLPNYIELDTESGELSWRTISETSIPEDRLFDYLIVKVAKD